jgi:integrase
MPQRRRRARGHIRELPSGSFQAIVYAGKDPLTGKERYERQTAKTYQAAEIALTKLQARVDEDRQPKCDLSVRQAIDQWLEVAKLEDTTRDRYDDLIRIYIGPTLGSMRAAKLDAQMLERWYARLQRCRSACDGRRRAGHACQPLSSSTVRKIHFILSAALGRAARWSQITVNTAQLAQAPAPAATEPDPPTADEAACRARTSPSSHAPNLLRGVGTDARLLGEAWATDPDWGLLLWLTMATGSRRGEVSALRWHHVGLVGALLTLQRSNAQPKSGLKEKQTKTRQQRRVMIDPQTVALLTAHRAVCEGRCAALGVDLDPDAYLFSPAPDGSTPWPPRSLTLRYGRLARRLQLRSTRLHSLRHYSATELIAAGTDVRTVAGRLGHGSGGATTLKIYAAWVDEAGQRATKTMAEIMPAVVVPAPRPPRGPYEVIAAELRQQIEEGRLALGSFLTTTTELAAAHNVSIATSHRAIALLNSEGLIEVSRGRRAVVRVAPPSSQVGQERHRSKTATSR